MTDAQRDLIRRSKERLEAARYLDDAISRAYYAMVHMAEAARLEYDVTPKTHKGLRGQFGKRFVTTGIFSSDMGRELRRVFDLRQMAEYSGTDLKEDTVDEVIERASSFVRAIESHLEELESDN